MDVHLVRLPAQKAGPGTRTLESPPPGPLPQHVHRHARPRAEAHRHAHRHTRTRAQAHAHPRIPCRSGAWMRPWRSRGGQSEFAPPEPLTPADLAGRSRPRVGVRTPRRHGQRAHAAAQTPGPAPTRHALHGLGAQRPHPCLFWLRPTPPPDLHWLWLQCHRPRSHPRGRLPSGIGCKAESSRVDVGLGAETKARWTGSPTNEKAQPP